MRVMLCGDWHGNLHWAVRCMDLAVEQEIDTIIQLGDFGFVFGRDNTGDLQSVLDEIEQDIHLAFLPGNHENWNLLDSRAQSTAPDGPFGGWLLQPDVEYLGRVGDFTIDGVQFISVGGAVSIDKGWRTPGKSWWWQEATTDESVVEAINLARQSSAPNCVMLSHDAPLNQTLENDLNSNDWHLSAKLEGESLENRVKLQCVWDGILPAITVHGHYHHPYVDTEKNIHGLHCDGHAEAVGVLDTETLVLTVARPASAFDG